MASLNSSGLPGSLPRRTHVAIGKAAALNLRDAANAAGITQRYLVDSVLADGDALKRRAIGLRQSLVGVDGGQELAESSAERQRPESVDDRGGEILAE